MSNAPEPDGPVPAWDIADRMRKALRHADVSVNEMAEHLGRDRNTISRYVNGHVPPSVGTLRVWALRCGVPFEWLKDGITAPDNGPGQRNPELCCTPPTSLDRARQARRMSHRVNPLPLAS